MTVVVETVFIFHFVRDNKEYPCEIVSLCLVLVTVEPMDGLPISSYVRKKCSLCDVKLIDKSLQDRQCTYGIILRRVRVTIFCRESAIT